MLSVYHRLLKGTLFLSWGGGGDPGSAPAAVVLTPTICGDDLVEAHAAAGVEVRLEGLVRAPLGGIVAARVRVVDVLDLVHRDPERRRLARQDVDTVLVYVR